MKKLINKEIAKLKAELDVNGGSVPDSWKPYLTLITTLLSIAEIFTNDATDKIIEEIKAAILLIENA